MQTVSMLTHFFIGQTSKVTAKFERSQLSSYLGIHEGHFGEIAKK